MGFRQLPPGLHKQSLQLRAEGRRLAARHAENVERRIDEREQLD